MQFVTCLQTGREDVSNDDVRHFRLGGYQGWKERGEYVEYNQGAFSQYCFAVFGHCANYFHEKV